MTDHDGDRPDPVRAENEWVDLVDLENRVVGRAPRGEVRARNLLHRGVGILCVSSRGEVYVHRRTDTKDVFPGMYDMFVGGVVSSGEAYAEAARREVEEELGVRGVTPTFLFAHLYQGDRNRSWIQVYEALWDGPIVHQEDEIAWGAWLPRGDLEAWAEAHAIVPDGMDVFERYLQWQRDGRPACEPLP